MEYTQKINLSNAPPAETRSVCIHHTPHIGPSRIGIIVEREQAVFGQQPRNRDRWHW